MIVDAAGGRCNEKNQSAVAHAILSRRGERTPGNIYVCKIILARTSIENRCSFGCCS
jgi:hypothetical protein